MNIPTYNESTIDLELSDIDSGHSERSRYLSELEAREADAAIEAGILEYYAHV